jgi:acetyltransferase-like isoleucine patch superfamily enzyme
LKKTLGNTIGKVVIEDDAWIGAGVIIMPNVKIGKCSIVGAGSVVTKDVKPFTKNAGIPSRILEELVLV